MAKVQFRVDKDGIVHLDVSGASGTECTELTAAFEERLGTKIDVQLKPDYDVVLDDMTLEAHEGEE